MSNNTRCTKGIILAAGRGSRLYPMTCMTNKQLLPIFDKPTIYYPLTTLMLAGINDILIICNPSDKPALENFLKTGSQWNIKISIAVQDEPRGLADAFLIGEDFINNQPVALILGDNLFHGQGFSGMLQRAARETDNGCQLFAYTVSDPKRYGVVELDNNNNAINIEEKPEQPRSNLAVTGLYFYDHNVVRCAKQLKPSKRGELEITDLNNIYLKNKKVKVHILGRGFVWFDVGTPQSMAIASEYVRVLEERQSISIASPEEVAWRMQYITAKELQVLINDMPQNCTYTEYLNTLLENTNENSKINNDEYPRRRKTDL